MWMGLLAVTMGASPLRSDHFALADEGTLEHVRAVYVTEWGVGRYNSSISEIDGNLITHLFYAFARIVDGHCTLSLDPSALETLDSIRLLKKRYSHLKTACSLVAVRSLNTG